MYDVVLWQVVPGGGVRAVSRSAAPAVQARTRHGQTQISHQFNLRSGTYVVEVIPQGSSSQDYLHFGSSLGEFLVRVTSPSGPQQHDDVNLVGKTQPDGLGMSLAQFLEARGTTGYSVEHGDPFHPPSSAYPWLAFASDGCTIPEGAWNEIGASVGLLIWAPVRDNLAVDSFATVDSHLLALLLEAWDRVVDPLQGVDDFLRSLEIVTFGRSLDQTMAFDDVDVPLYLACLRHDFNWRNLHRVEHDVNPEVNSWTDSARRRADSRFEQDFDLLCRMNPVQTQASPHFDWQLPTMAAIEACLVKASYLVDVVSVMPDLAIGFFYAHQYR